MPNSNVICTQANNSTLPATPQAGAKSAHTSIVDCSLTGSNQTPSYRQNVRQFFEALKPILPGGVRLTGKDVFFFDDLTEGYCKFTHNGKKYSITMSIGCK